MNPHGTPSYSNPNHREPTAFEHIGAALALGACAVADAINFQTAFARMYRSESDLTLWLLVLGGTVASLIAAHTAGREFKRTWVGDPEGHPWIGYFATAILVLITLTTALVRVLTNPPAQQAIGAFGVAQVDASQHWAHNIPAALFFSAIFLASCVTAIAIGFSWNPLRAKLLAARRANVRATRRTAKANAALARAVTFHAELEDERQGWVQRHAKTLDGLHGLADEARALARTEAARYLGNPTATSSLTASLPRPATHTNPQLQLVDHTQ